MGDTVCTAPNRCNILISCSRVFSDAQKLVQLIQDSYNPFCSVQWGSVLQSEKFREHSDIDLAVEGITDPEVFFLLLREAEEVPRFSVDIVQLERIEPELRELILKKGTVVYEQLS